MAWYNSILNLFGSGQKDIVQETADIVDKFHPSEVTRHELNIEDIKTGDASQASARAYEPARGGYVDKLNLAVDALNRLPRPLFALWAFAVLCGIIPQPSHLNDLNPIVLNMIWTIVGFFFGVRAISQDIPKLLASLRR